MSTIVTRAGKGSPLTHTEVDNNFTNLNTDKVETSGGTLTNPTINGNVLTTGINIDSDTLIVDATNNAVGIGGNTTGTVAGVPITSKFCVKNEGDAPVAGFVHANNTTASSGSITFACRSRGTLASPSVVQNNDSLWNMYIAGHDGTDLALGAEITVEVDGTPSGNDMPARIVIKTTPDGSQIPEEAMRIDSTQTVNIGKAVISTSLNVTGTASFDGSQGTSGQVLTSAGAGNTPTWETVSGSISVTGGDLTLSGSTGTDITNATLATVNSNVGSYGSSSAIPVVTVNAKGLVTGVTTATVAGGQYFGSATTKAIAYNAQTIAENVTVTTGNNGLSAGPITIDSGFTVTVESGANWVVV
jgi:hypothetical protein